MDPQRIEELLVRIDERTKSMDERWTRRVEADDKKHDDFEKRIRWNEKFRNAVLGAVGVGGVGAGSWSFMDLFK